MRPAGARSGIQQQLTSDAWSISAVRWALRMMSRQANRCERSASSEKTMMPEREVSDVLGPAGMAGRRSPLAGASYRCSRILTHGNDDRVFEGADRDSAALARDIG